MRIVEDVFRKNIPAGKVAFSMNRTEPGKEVQEEMVSEWCTKPIVFLGEASHGVGATFELKAKLIVELVDRCELTSFCLKLESMIISICNRNTLLSGRNKRMPHTMLS